MHRQGRTRVKGKPKGEPSRGRPGETRAKRGKVNTIVTCLQIKSHLRGEGDRKSILGGKKLNYLIPGKKTNTGGGKKATGGL